MKKIINDPAQAVSEMLSGMAQAHPELRYIPEHQIICRKRKKAAGKVGVISGGGSGHEPAHAGYVGYGMLDASVSGNVFASPGPDSILRAIQEADNGAGVLLIIKNYSGDVMNFQMAQELAAMEGIHTSSVIVRDDVSVPDSDYSTGRRGIAGTVFVHKAAGAKAEQGASLDEVTRVAQKTADSVRSMGMALSSCILPEVGVPNFHLNEDEIELGMGIHGEPGVERIPCLPAASLAERLMNRILSDMDYKDSDVAVMVNGMGATPLMELYIFYNDVVRCLKQRRLSVSYSLVGNYMTSLEMAGCSLSLLKLDDEIKALLKAPASAAAWKEGV